MPTKRPAAAGATRRMEALPRLAGLRLSRDIAAATPCS
jgi:hypothetical protein